MTSFIPKRADSFAEAWELVQVEGAALIKVPDTSSSGSEQAGGHFMGSHLVSMGDPFVVSAKPNARITYAAHTELLLAHTDGFGYGKNRPDYLGLHCVSPSLNGGDSFILDGYALLEKLALNPEHADLLDWMWTVPIDQTKNQEAPYVAPILSKTPSGRTWISQNHFYQKPTIEGEEGSSHQSMIDRWIAVLKAESEQSVRFQLESQDCLFADNYRILHGRDAYFNDTSFRVLHRLWMWSSQSIGVPEASAALSGV